MKRSCPAARQSGLTLIGFMFAAVLVLIAAGIAMKVVPAYIEFYSLKGIIQAMKAEPGFSSMSDDDLRKSYERRATTAYVTVVKSSQLKIDHGRNGVAVTAQYAYRTHLVGNVSLVLDFFTSTDPDAQPVPSP